MAVRMAKIYYSEKIPSTVSAGKAALGKVRRKPGTSSKVLSQWSHEDMLNSPNNGLGRHVNVYWEDQNFYWELVT